MENFFFWGCGLFTGMTLSGFFWGDRLRKQAEYYRRDAEHYKKLWTELLHQRFSFQGKAGR